MNTVQSEREKLFSLTSELFTDRHAWEDVVKAKLAFLQSGCTTEIDSLIRPVVAESWNRSCAMGISIDKKNLSLDISHEDYEATRKRYRTLVDEARPLLSEINQLDLSNNYIFELIIEEGTSLLQIGDYERKFYISEQSIFNESTMGTNAHSLCMRQKSPLVIVGPEHYCSALRDLAAVAAPILDKDGSAVASLLLIQDLPQNPWTEEYRKLLSQAKALISSIASTIESRAKFHAAKTVLENVSSKINTIKVSSQRSQDVLEAAFLSSPDIVFAVNTNGLIEQASAEAARLLATDTGALRGKHLDELFGKNFSAKFSSTNLQTQLITAKNGVSYHASIHPIPGTKDKEQNGYVLRLTPAQANDSTQKAKTPHVGSILTFDDILGKSPEIQTTIKLAKRYAPTMENILIEGESGTGKEYFAQAIHHAARPQGPFVSLNCAAIPAHLIESELFGYEAGSFTGADRKGSAGKIELAHGGTLFLDEIGDMPLDLQATLLRVLENKQVMRVGGKKYKQVDFRIIAATNRGLMNMVEEGTFRDDLLYRLSILVLSIPPLRERQGDCEFFAQHFLEQCRIKNPDGPIRISPAALAKIRQYRWPGNVRQLKNTISSSYYSATTDAIEVENLPLYLVHEGKGAPSSSSSPSILSNVSADDPESLSLQKLEESAIKLALLHSDNNVAKASELLQISKATLYRKIKDYGISLH